MNTDANNVDGSRFEELVVDNLVDIFTGDTMAKAEYRRRLLEVTAQIPDDVNELGVEPTAVLRPLVQMAERKLAAMSTDERSAKHSAMSARNILLLSSLLGKCGEIARELNNTQATNESEQETTQHEE